MKKDLQFWYEKLDTEEVTGSRRKKIFYNVKGDFLVKPERPLKKLEEIAEITLEKSEDYDRLEWAIQERKEIFIKFFIEKKEILNDWFFVIGISGRAPAKKFKIINSQVKLTEKEEKILNKKTLFYGSCAFILSQIQSHKNDILRGRA